MSSSAFELKDLLENEKRLILNGSLDEVDRLSTLKAVLVGRLAEEPPSKTLAIELQTSIRTNQQLLQAAALGIRSAMSEIREARSFLDQTTYDGSGKRKRLQAAERGFERRV